MLFLRSKDGTLQALQVTKSPQSEPGSDLLVLRNLPPVLSKSSPLLNYLATAQDDESPLIISIKGLVRESATHYILKCGHNAVTLSAAASAKLAEHLTVKNPLPCEIAESSSSAAATPADNRCLYEEMHSSCFVDPDAMLDSINEYMEEYSKTEARNAEAAKRKRKTANLADDDGWITVGGAAADTNGGNASKKRSEKQGKSSDSKKLKKNRIEERERVDDMTLNIKTLSNFYKFQAKEKEEKGMSYMFLCSMT